MKRLLQPLTNLMLFALFMLIGCKDKDLIIERPGGRPQPVPASTKVVVTLESLPGETDVATDLFAVITVVDQQNQPVLTNKKVALNHDGNYVTDTLTLLKGQYKISRFLVVDKNNVTRFATPIAGSEMSGQVQHPLYISFTLPQPTASKIALDVLRLAAGAQPEKYGYPAGAFNLPNTQDPDETETPDPNPFIKIKVRPLIKIGDIVYDSVPVAFTLTSWNAAGQPTVSNLNLAPGTNEISLPKAAVKYDLQVKKWGTVDELSLLKQDVEEGAIYALGGSKAAKKLKSEILLKMVKGAWVAESRNVFEYDANGKLLKVLQQRKRADNSIYVHTTDYFSYNAAGQVEKIIKKDESNHVVKENVFSYNQEGKISSMLQKEGAAQTSANVTYTGRPGSTGITANYDIDIRYQYSQNQLTSQYTMNFKGGNNVASDLLFSNGGRERVNFQYDFNINPYVHLNWPDLYLSHSSKHNIGAQQNGYDGSYAKSEYPAASEYIIDADGYPTQAITHYMHPFLGIYLYKTKTVYNY